MPTGIVKNGVILRSLGGYMRKFKIRRPRVLPFRSLLILSGALLLMPAFAPSAKADVIAYFNFEDAADTAAVDFTSESDQGLGLATTITSPFGAPPCTRTVPYFPPGLRRPHTARHYPP